MNNNYLSEAKDNFKVNKIYIEGNNESDLLEKQRIVQKGKSTHFNILKQLNQGHISQPNPIIQSCI